MRELMRDLMKAKLSRRGFVASMVSAGYTVAAARSALASAAPFLQGAEVAPSLTRVVQGSGGELLADQIIEAGARYMFVSNGSGLGPLCDALVTRNQIELIQATDEGQVMAVADGYAKATLKPAFGMFSRVGLPKASSNMYNSMKDRTPVVLFSDHANASSEGRDQGEDIEDWIDSVRPYTKWRWVCRRASRIPEWVRNATKIAGVLPYGPTYVRFPRDVLYEQNIRATIFTGKAFEIPMKLSADPSEVERAARILLNARSSLMIVGFEVTQTGAQQSLVRLAELLGLPVRLARGYGMDFPTGHPLCVGEPRRLRYPNDVDCVVNFGAPDFPGVATGRGVSLIHASVDPETIGRNVPLDVALLGDLDLIAQQMIEAVEDLRSPSALASQTRERREEISAFTQSSRKARMEMARAAEGSPVPWYRVMAELDRLAEPDAIIVPETGDDGRVSNFFNFAPNARWKIGRTRGQALGWGVGAAAGVKLAHPDRQVIAIQGDGGFLFGQSDALWTLSRHDIPILVVIMNNRSYEATRWRIMARNTPAGRSGRDFISYLGDPDVNFAAIASAYRIDAETVEDTNQLGPAIQKAFRVMRDGRPFLLDIRTKTTGVGAELTWYPKVSVAAKRTKLV